MGWRAIEATVVLVIHDGRTLVLRRRPDEIAFPLQWCLPGGRVEEGETPRETALREAWEETGLVVALDEFLGPRESRHPRLRTDFTIHRFVGHAPHDRAVLSDEHVAMRWLERHEAERAHELLPSGLAGEVTAELLARFARGE